MFSSLILVLHISISIVLVGIVLLQQGKGADAGVSLGGGGSNTLFGAGGADTFLVRLTTICAVLFFLTSMSLALQAKVVPTTNKGILFQNVPESESALPTALPTTSESVSSEEAPTALPQAADDEVPSEQAPVEQSQPAAAVENSATDSDKSENDQ